MLVNKFAQKGVPLGTVSSVTVKGVLRTLQTITGGAIREVESSWAGKRDSPTCGVGKSLSLSLLLLLRPHSQGRQKAVTCRSACARALVLPVGVNLTKNDEARSLSLALSHLSKP